MTRTLALFLLVLAATPARAQSGDDPARTPAERFDEVEATAWGGALSNLETISAMLDRLSAPIGTRMRQDSLVVIANASAATRGVLFITVQFTATRLDSDRLDETMRPLAEATLGLVDLLGQTAFEASADALDAGTAAKTLDGPARAVQIRALADIVRQSTAALGIAAP